MAVVKMFASRLLSSNGTVCYILLNIISCTLKTILSQVTTASKGNLE